MHRVRPRVWLLVGSVSDLGVRTLEIFCRILYPIGMGRVGKILLLLILVGCSSQEKHTIGMQDLDGGSQAHGAAFLTDAINIRTPMEVSAPDWRPLPFYFKECTEVGERYYYSKTAYDCTYP